MIDRIQSEVDMVKRHIEVLKVVREHGPIGIVKLSEETDYAHHKVRYSLRILEEEELIEPTNGGARTKEGTEEFIDEINGEVDEIIETLKKMKIDN